MDFPTLAAEDLATIFINGVHDPSKRPVLILGAGASIPSLPSAYNLKVEIATNAILQATKEATATSAPANNENIISSSVSHSSSSSSLSSFHNFAKSIIHTKCEQHHITLEVLVSLITFRSNNKLNTDEMWNALCEDCTVNEFSFMIALLIKWNCIHRILTSNFDHVLEDACRDLDVENFQVVTNVQLLEKENKQQQQEQEEQRTGEEKSHSYKTDICPFHGTTYKDGINVYTEPFTATATGLAKPFSKVMSNYIEETIGDGIDNDNQRPILVFGYSGNDHFDLNPLLSKLKLDDPTRFAQRKKWFWVVHGGMRNNVSDAICKIFGVDDHEHQATPSVHDNNALYGGDTLTLMRNAFQIVQNKVATGNKKNTHDIIIPRYHDQKIQSLVLSKSTYQQQLQEWFTQNFTWKINEANDMILDLQNNLIAAWIVSEHYRLVQLGYDEEYSFRFAGIFDLQSSSRSIGFHPHLALEYHNKGASTLEFGHILEAARIYRIEMNDKDQLFDITSSAMKEFIKQAMNALNSNTPSRKSEIAGINIGLSIAYDYLGLIGGRKVTKTLKMIKQLKREKKDKMDGVNDTSESIDDKIEEQEALLALARDEASEGFEKCIEFATIAQDSMESSLLETLIPAATWIQIGTDNMGRFKIPGSDDAIHWLVKAIKGRKALIEDEIKQSRESGETDVSTSKIVSVEMHFPPLWRRGGELVQQVLETQGFNAAPTKLMSDLSKERRRLVQFGYQTSENAYKRHQEWNSVPNQNFPAVYDVRVLVALAKGDVQAARHAVDVCKNELGLLPKSTFSASKLQSLQGWVRNIEARIDDFEDKYGSSNRNQSVCNQCLIS